MNLKKIGKLLCNLRKSKGMTQKQVADRLGVLPKTVSKWETGNCLPDASKYKPLCEILGITVNELFSRERLNSETENEVKDYLLDLPGMIKSLISSHKPRLLCFDLKFTKDLPIFLESQTCGF